MQVIGLCRFSYPGIGGFQIEHDNLEERRAFLYAPERMEDRLRQFECIALPGLRAQTDPDFTFVVVIGDSLPARWHKRLLDLLEDFPQARIQVHPPGPHRAVMQDAINAVRRPSEPSLQFRHDDDDAVAVDFVARLRGAAVDCTGLVARHRMVAFDFNRGYIARPGPDGIRAEPSFTPYYGVALAVAVQPGVRQTIMNFAHNKLSRFMPTVTLTDSPMWVRGHNDFNDSRQKPGVKPVQLPLLDAAGEQDFADHFAIDAGHVRRVFSAP
jgi:hypothetical protein